MYCIVFRYNRIRLFTVLLPYDVNFNISEVRIDHGKTINYSFYRRDLGVFEANNGVSQLTNRTRIFSDIMGVGTK